MEDADTDESWEPPDEYLSSRTLIENCNGHLADSDSEIEKVNTSSGRGEMPHSCGVANPPLQANMYCMNRSNLPTSRDAGSSQNSETSMFSGSTKRKRQGLHGRQEILPKFLFKHT